MDRAASITLTGLEEHIHFAYSRLGAKLDEGEPEDLATLAREKEKNGRLYSAAHFYLLVALRSLPDDDAEGFFQKARGLLLSLCEETKRATK